MAEQKTSNPADSTGYFSGLAKDDATKLVTDSLPEIADVSAAFMAGDHWQTGKGWVGPVPDQDDSDYGTTLDLIEAAFTSRNVIKEIVQRHMRGVVGEEPTFGVVPRAPLKPGAKLEDAKMEQKRTIEAALTDWWDRRGAHLRIQEALSNAQWSERGILRLYVPEGKLNNGTIPKQVDLETALSLIYLDAPSPENAAVVVHETTKDEAGILLTEVDGNTVVEISYLGPVIGTPGAAPDPKNARVTIIRTISDDGDDSVEVQFGGRTTMFAITRKALITEQLHQMQRALNLCLSMIPRNIVTAGFLERIILNALPPGHWELDARGRKTRFVREPWLTGPGTTSWLRGIELPQKDGGTMLTTPSVQHRDPVDTAPADDAVRAIYRDMLEEADQSHVLVTSEATPSGASRREGRSDFSVSLTESEAPTNAAGRWLIETLLAMAEQFMQQPGGILADWRGQFECLTNAGPVTVEERAQVIAELDAGLMSFETAMSRIGIIDVQAEMDRILTENGGVNLAMLDRRLKVLVSAVGAVLAIDAVAEILGFDPATAKKLIGTLGDNGGAGATPTTDPNGGNTGTGGGSPTQPPTTDNTQPQGGAGNSNA